jgi:hypothetical protein
MKNLFLIFSHTLTPEQIADAKHSLGVANFVSLPENLKTLWGNVPPEADVDFATYLQPIKDFLAQNANSNDFVLVQGDFGATFHLVNHCKQVGYVPAYATTERVAVEQTQADGSVVLQKVFKHKAFRRY